MLVYIFFWGGKRNRFSKDRTWFMWQFLGEATVSKGISTQNGRKIKAKDLFHKLPKTWCGTHFFSLICHPGFPNCVTPLALFLTGVALSQAGQSTRPALGIFCHGIFRATTFGIGGFTRTLEAVTGMARMTTGPKFRMFSWKLMVGSDDENFLFKWPPFWGTLVHFRGCKYECFLLNS